jgi:hypothetical protein
MVRDALEDALRDAAHDAFMAFWRAADTLAAEQLWLAYCVAQERYEAVMARQMGRYYWLAREQSHHAKKTDHNQRCSIRHRQLRVRQQCEAGTEDR